MNRNLYEKLEQQKQQSAWGKGVKEQALEMIEAAEVELTRENVREELLKGASDWSEYSYGGGALVYDSDIAERYCTLSELKRKEYGNKKPNSREEWLDVQARALERAYLMIKRNI